MPASSSRSDGVRPAWCKLRKLPIPQKAKVFAWRLIHNGLATKVNKWRRTLATDRTCDISGNADEDEHHAVICCNHALALRSAMRPLWALPEKKLVF